MAIDDAAVMIGCSFGMLGDLRENIMNLHIYHNIIPVHFIVHVQNLCYKIIKPNTMINAVVKTKNAIRSKGFDYC